MRTLTLGAVVATALSGCTSLPHPTAEVANPVTDAKMVEVIRCAYVAAFTGDGADPAGLRDWSALATLTETRSTGTVVVPGVAVADGSVGDLKWKAVSGGTKFDKTSEGKSVLEYPMMHLSAAGEAGSCSAPGSSTAVTGLDLADWLKTKAAGMPHPDTHVTTKSLGYIRNYTVTATAGGGLSFTLGDLKLGLEGNSFSRSAKYEINIQFMQPEMKKADVKGAMAAMIDALRQQRDADEDEKTTITVAPGQTVIIQ